MFDQLAAQATSASGGAAVMAWARVENAACARRLAAMADVLERRWAEDGSAEREQWCLDNWTSVACEVAAATREWNMLSKLLAPADPNHAANHGRWVIS